MKFTLQKTTNGWIPADEETADAHRKMKIGDVLHGDFAKMRNPKFHRLFFALIKLAFDYWEPGEIDSKYGKPEKNFDQFRKDLTILAGYYTVVIRLDGSTRIEPKSISFASMDETEFQKLYQAVLTVIIERIPVMCDMSKDEINFMVDAALAFA